MNPSQLYQTIIHAIKAVRPEHELTDMQCAILEDICEHVLNSNTVDRTNASEMVAISLNSFEASYQLIRAMIGGVIDYSGSISINFRGRDFCFDKNNNVI